MPFFFNIINKKNSLQFLNDILCTVILKVGMSYLVPQRKIPIKSACIPNE